MPGDIQGKRGTRSVGGTSTFPVPGNKNKTSFKGLVIGIQATQKTGTSKLEHIPHISLAYPADQVRTASTSAAGGGATGRAELCTSTKADPVGTREGDEAASPELTHGLQGEWAENF